MAQYFNVVTNASGTLTFEELPRVCTVDGQQVQLVVEDVNNGGNGSQQFVTCTATPQNRQAIFTPQTINLGNQITATRLEQGQNVFIIKTNDLAQEIIKSNTVNVINENIVGFVDSTECKNDGQQIQWIKMQNASTIAATKQNTLLQENNQTAILTKNHIQNNITSSPPVYVNSGSVNTGQTEKNLPKFCPNQNQQLNSVQVGVASQSPDGINVLTTMENRIQNSTPKSAASVCGKTIRPKLGQNLTVVRPVRIPNSPSVPYVRPVAVVTPEMSKTPRMRDIEHLHEQIKQAKIKQMQSQRQSHVEKQRLSQNNAQRQQHSNASQQLIQTPPNNPARRPLTSNSVQQRTQQVARSTQGSQVMRVNTNADVNPPDCVQEKGHVTRQSSSPRSEHETNSSSESVAYLQKTINDPTSAIVQDQIKANTAKMLVMLASGEQRLITFDLPTDDCTVHDLLEQLSISSGCETVVSLVDDPTLGINYIVETNAVAFGTPHDSSDHSDCNSSQETVSSTTANENLSQSTNASDENSNTALTTNEMFYKKNNERKLEKAERDGPTSKRPKGKGKGAASKPKPIHKEPECLTISSDEEEEGRAKKIGNINSDAAVGNANNTFDEEVDTILDKEPIITNSTVSSSYDENSISDNESLLENGELPETALQCRTVRIGSYKYIPREKIVITHNGIRFSVPLLEDDTSFVTLDVKYRDIIKLLIHFGKSMPVLFFYTTTTTGAMIRELLGMQDPKGPYYDPAGKDHTHKRITLLPDRLEDDSKAKLLCLFSRGDKIQELNPKEANDVLLRASPKDCIRKVNQSLPNVGNLTDSIQTITVYPPPPAKGGIAINTEDYLCLAEDQFLNDVIIDFYLKYLTLEVLSESDQHRTHVFSSYFYKRLTSPHAQAAESIVPMTPAAKRHARVQKWTKNVNIFEKDFVIIPINEHAHWFLAIICFPGLVGKVSTCAPKPNGDDVHKTAQKSKKMKEGKAKAVTIGSTTITPVPATITIDPVDDGSERDEAEGDDEEMEIDSDEEDESEQSEETKPHPDVKVEQKEIVKVPCILIFDSLAGASRARVVATLRDYLTCEYIAKLGVEKTFSKDTIKGACPKVPQQSNFTDCGMYVLQYVESFFKNPITDYTLPIKTLKTWFEEIVVTRKREELSKLLIKLMNNTRGDKLITLPTVNFPTQDGKLKPKSESPADAKATKPELENKRKTSLDAETRISMSIVADNESSNEFTSRTTYQIIPYSTCISSNSAENNSTEMLTEQKTTRSSSETMSYLKAKRIPRLMSRTQNQDDSPTSAKKHKGESINSCK
ncbi:Sentrin-specific protease [Ooceraea biroi]|uniref:Sentrin-specific protease n=1 Tax=Ooceraea biroi TaxID=2015173 RepID=A0A026WNL8_OOCBI|nr:Sentrin-specific protease [Ooceraea biroi]